MQLGELQNQIQRFERRQAQIIGISVDPAADSEALAARLGLTFPLASDPDQSVVKAFGVQNPDTKELALHAVYIVTADDGVIYRKVGLRRPVSAELIDAIDAHYDRYPKHDTAAPAQRISVAYPQNNFQAILEISKWSGLPANVHEEHFEQAVDLLEQRRGDDAVFAYRAFLNASTSASEAELLAAVRHLVYLTMYEGQADVLSAGKDLEKRLERVSDLEAQEIAARGSANHDPTIHTLARARAGLTRARAGIRSQSDAWRLQSAKVMLRSYRELTFAHLRSR